MERRGFKLMVIVALRLLGAGFTRISAAVVLPFGHDKLAEVEEPSFFALAFKRGDQSGTRACLG